MINIEYLYSLCNFHVTTFFSLPIVTEWNSVAFMKVPFFIYWKTGLNSGLRSGPVRKLTSSPVLNTSTLLFLVQLNTKQDRRASSSVKFLYTYAVKCSTAERVHNYCLLDILFLYVFMHMYLYTIANGVVAKSCDISTKAKCNYNSAPELKCWCTDLQTVSVLIIHGRFQVQWSRSCADKLCGII